MQIYVVQVGDTINSIADKYGISAAKLIQDNGLEDIDNLVIGQSLVIAIPEQIYTIQEGDTLQGIAVSHNVTLMQLLRNNPFLSNREYIYPGETIVIKYNNTKGILTTHANAFPFINQNTLRKTLPYLTYLSIINYTATTEGEIITYYDDTEIIKLIKDYEVMPLMLLTTLTIKGVANIGVAFDILLNKDFQNRQIDNILSVLREKGYYGVNISFQYINISTTKVYEEYLLNIFTKLNREGYFVFVTIAPGISSENQEIRIERVDYRIINRLSNNIIFMPYEWSTNINPPSPITSVNNINIFIDYVKTIIPPDKVIVGIPNVGFDWQLPFVAGISDIRLLSLNNAIELAREVGAIIQFDELSQTPYFTYNANVDNTQILHIVWFIDARSISSILNLTIEDELLGTGIWNIMSYNPQLWLVINSQYEITKIIKT